MSPAFSHLLLNRWNKRYDASGGMHLYPVNHGVRPHGRLLGGNCSGVSIDTVRVLTFPSSPAWPWHSRAAERHPTVGELPTSRQGSDTMRHAEAVE